MSEKSFGSALVGPPRETMNDAGGITLAFDEMFESQKVDFSNEENIKVMTTRAVGIANSVRSLVHNNCNTEAPIQTCKTSIEVLLSLSAFSCEIYLKAISYYSNKHDGKRLKTHKLDELFSKLPDDGKRLIRARISDLDNRLSDVSEAYMELRYVFEHNAFNREYFLIFDLMDALHDYCTKLPKHEHSTLTYGAGVLKVEEIRDCP